ncbi:MAG TPA: hypothetical protein VGF69_21875 [Thermoanaerobaculia bacterium]|jgi:hypothetical protein
MIISVINHTNGEVPDEELQRVLRSINRQIQEDFAPYWSLSATLRLEGRTSSRPGAAEEVDADMRGDAIIYIWDKADAEEALGYHERNHHGIPYGFVFTEVCTRLCEPWSVALSHEALEMIGDPETNLLVMGPHPGDQDRVVFHWLELCDAVQTEWYEIDKVAVSNFVLPLYFTGTRKVDEPGARNDFLGRSPLRSFGVKPGGYVGYYDPLEGEHFKHFCDCDGEAQRRDVVKNAVQMTRRGERYQMFAQRLESVLTKQRTLEIPFPVMPDPGIEVHPRDLEPGDILLSRRAGRVSHAISLFDGTPVTTASLYLGNFAVAEVGRDSIVRRDLDGATSGTEWVKVRRLASEVEGMEPVLVRARRYLERASDYGYDPMVLLTFLALGRKPKHTPSLSALLQRILQTATDVLVRRNPSEPRAPLFGSELIYRCFDEAISRGDSGYAIIVDGDGPSRRALDSNRGRGIERGSLLEAISTRRFRTGAFARTYSREVPLETIIVQYTTEQNGPEASDCDVVATPELQRGALQFAFALYAVQHGGQYVSDPRIAIDNLLKTVRDYVSPGDLYSTSTLRTVGNLAALPPETANHFATVWEEQVRQIAGAARLTI